MAVAGQSLRSGEGYPDMQAMASASMTREPELHALLDTFGPGNPHVEMGLGIPVTSDTLKNKYTGVNVKLSQRLRVDITRFDGWEASFAPITTAAMTHEVRTSEFPAVTMEHAPEGTAPRLLRHIERVTRFDMQRYAIGAQFHDDWFRTPEGQQQFKMSWRTMVSSAWRRLKMTVKAVAINTKTIWSMRNRAHPIRHSGILDGTADERSMAFILASDNQKAVYILSSIVDRIAASEGMTFDSGVFPEGTLQKLAFSNFETEANRRGESTAQDRLNRGGSSMRVIGNKAIYEDASERVDNDPKYRFEPLSNVGQFGQMYYLDGSDPSKLLCVPCGRSHKTFSIQIPDAKIDGWKTKHLLWCHQHSMRYAPDGSLDKMRHQIFLDSLGDIQQQAGLRVGNQNPDPYVWKTGAQFGGLDRVPRGNGYRMIEHYGDADLRNWPISHHHDFGKKAKELMFEDGVLNEGAIARLGRIRAISSQLNSFDPLAAGPQAFFAAVALNPENGPASAGYLAANQFGGVWPPTVTAAGMSVGGQTVNVDGGGFSLAQAAAAGGGGGGTAAPSPTVPYGFGGITGLRTLAHLFQSGDLRGYDRGLLTEIAAGVDTLDNIVNWLLARLPRNLYTKPGNVPVFIRTNDPMMNTINSIILSVFQDLPHPVMIRTPVGGAVSSGLPTAGAGAAATARGMASNDAVSLSMGFTTTGGGPLDTSVAPMGADVDDALDALRSSRNLSAKVQSAIFSVNPADRVNMFSAYETIGRSYGTYLTSKGGFSGSGAVPSAGYDKREFSRFAWFFREEIAPMVKAGNTNGAVNLFNGILLLALGDSADSQITREYLAALQRGGDSGKGSKRQAFDVGTRTGLQGTGTTRDPAYWTNTRLTNANNTWHTIAARIEADTSGNTLLNFYRSVLRPSDPTNTGLALAGDLISGNDSAVTSALVPGGIKSDDAKNLGEQLKFARAGLNGRGLGILQHNGLLNAGIAKSSPAEAQRARLREGHPSGNYSQRQLDLFAELDGSTAIRSGGVIPGEIAEDMTGPFFETVPYEDRYGRPTTDMVQIVSKKYLVARIHAIEKIQDDVARMAAILQVLSEAHMDNIEGCLTRGLPVFGSCFILAQPWVRVNGAAAIWFASGGVAAQSGAKWENVMLQANAAHKKWLMHMTLWCGAAITDNRGYLIQNHLDTRGYRSGYTDDVFTNPEEFDPNNIEFEKSPSMFVFDCGSNKPREELKNPITLSGRYHQDAFSAHFENMDALFEDGEPNYPSALFYNSVWHFYMIDNFGPSRESFGAEQQSIWTNEVMYSNNQKEYNATQDDYSTFTRGTGHLSKFAPPFVARLNGQQRLIESSDLPIKISI